MRKKLTTKTVEALSNKGPKRLEIWDISLPGFGIRVSPSGSKTWFCTARQSGRSRRFTLGPLGGGKGGEEGGKGKMKGKKKKLLDQPGLTVVAADSGQRLETGIGRSLLRKK